MSRKPTKSVDFLNIIAYSWAMRTSVLLLVCVLAVGCHSSGQPAGTISREKYLAVYCDLMQEALRSRNSGADPRTARQNADSIFARRGTTRAEFDSTTHWFNADVRRWKSFFDEAAKELEARESLPVQPPR
jgi:hypothetical protein